MYVNTISYSCLWRVIYPDLPLDLTGFSPGKHLILF